jgi:hypothetical protein
MAPIGQTGFRVLDSDMHVMEPPDLLPKREANTAGNITGSYLRLGPYHGEGRETGISSSALVEPKRLHAAQCEQFAALQRSL